MGHGVPEHGDLVLNRRHLSRVQWLVNTFAGVERPIHGRGQARAVAKGPLCRRPTWRATALSRAATVRTGPSSSSRARPCAGNTTWRGCWCLRRTRLKLENADGTTKETARVWAGRGRRERTGVSERPCCEHAAHREACARVWDGALGVASALEHSRRHDPVGARCRGTSGCRRRLQRTPWPRHVPLTLQSRWQELHVAALLLSVSGDGSPVNSQRRQPSRAAPPTNPHPHTKPPHHLPRVCAHDVACPRPHPRQTAAPPAAQRHPPCVRAHGRRALALVLSLALSTWGCCCRHINEDTGEFFHEKKNENMS